MIKVLQPWSLYFTIDFLLMHYRLKSQIPDIKKTLDIVHHLQSKKVSSNVTLHSQKFCMLFLSSDLFQNLVVLQGFFSDLGSGRRRKITTLKMTS